jgi:hypothetical protein
VPDLEKYLASFISQILIKRAKLEKKSLLCPAATTVINLMHAIKRESAD